MQPIIGNLAILLWQMLVRQLLEKDNIFVINSDKKLTKNKKKYFAGIAVLNDLSKTIATKEQKVYAVLFKRGARTKLHYHMGGQILITTKGKGMLVIYRGQGVNYRKRLKIKKMKEISLCRGDIVYIKPRQLHWHGSKDKRADFSHIAINSKIAGKEAKTVWFESDYETFAERMN